MHNETLAKNNKGFSLMEILVVVIILAIACGIGIPAIKAALEATWKATDGMTYTLEKTTANSCVNDSITRESITEKITIYITNEGTTMTGASDRFTEMYTRLNPHWAEHHSDTPDAVYTIVIWPGGKIDPETPPPDWDDEDTRKYTPTPTQKTKAYISNTPTPKATNTPTPTNTPKATNTPTPTATPTPVTYTLNTTISSGNGFVKAEGSLGLVSTTSTYSKTFVWNVSPRTFTSTISASPKTGSRFVAWYSDAGCTTQVSTSASYTYTATVPNTSTTKTLYAKFVTCTPTPTPTPATVTIKLSPGKYGGSVKLNSGTATTGTLTQTVNSGSSNIISATAGDLYDGFTGWYTDYDCTKLYTSTQNYTFTATSSLTLYAGFKIASSTGLYSTTGTKIYSWQGCQNQNVIASATSVTATVARDDKGNLLYSGNGILVVPTTVTALSGFAGTTLTAVCIPTTVKTIGAQCFANTDCNVITYTTMTGLGTLAGTYKTTKYTFASDAAQTMTTSTATATLNATSAANPATCDLSYITSLGEKAFWQEIEPASYGSGAKTTDKALTGQGGPAGQVVFPKVATIPTGAFRGCTRMTGSIVISDTTTTIGEAAFQACYGISTALVLGKSVTTIRACAFQGCKSIGTTGPYTHYQYPEARSNNEASVIRAASGNTKKTSILTFPDTLTVVEHEAFHGLRNIRIPSLPKNLKVYQYKVFAQIGQDLVIDGTGMWSTHVDNGYAWAIPEGATQLDAMCFYDCIGLRYLYIPSTVKKCGYPSTGAPSADIDQSLFYWNNQYLLIVCFYGQKGPGNDWTNDWNLETYGPYADGLNAIRGSVYFPRVDLFSTTQSNATSLSNEYIAGNKSYAIPIANNKGKENVCNDGIKWRWTSLIRCYWRDPNTGYTIGGDRDAPYRSLQPYEKLRKDAGFSWY